MKYLLMIACALLLVGSSLFAQSKQIDKSQPTTTPESHTDQVEVKTDRFSGVTTVRLKPQMILDTPDHFITMSLEAKFGDKKIRTEMDQAAEIMGEGAMIRFESQAKGKTDFGDQELHFIIDGKRLKVGESSGGVSNLPSRDPRLKPGFKVLESFVNTLTTAQLKQIAGGSRVEMRLGKYEFVLGSSVLGNLREFVSEFSRQAPSSKQKGNRP